MDTAYNSSYCTVKHRRRNFEFLTAIVSLDIYTHVSWFPTIGTVTSRMHKYMSRAAAYLGIERCSRCATQHLNTRCRASFNSSHTDVQHYRHVCDYTAWQCCLERIYVLDTGAPQFSCLTIGPNSVQPNKQGQKGIPKH